MPRSRSATPFIAIAVVSVLSACDPSAGDPGRAVSREAPAKGVVDSMLPPEELLRRFRIGLDTPSVLDGPASIDSLINSFAKAVASKDRAGLEKLLVTKAEFAWLVFPELRISKDPYRQPPEIAWLLSSAAIATGINRLMDRTFQFRGHTCIDPPAVEGAVRLWRCTVRVTYDGRELDARLFSPIVERDGQFRFLGYDTDL